MGCVSSVASNADLTPTTQTQNVTQVQPQSPKTYQQTQQPEILTAHIINTASNPPLPLDHNGLISLDTMSSLLHSVPLLSKLTNNERDQLAQLLSEQKHNNNAIITEGEPGQGFYIIAKGECEVTKRNQKNENVHIATLKDGDFFGETALINNAKRGATVTAKGVVTVLYLQRVHFQSLFGQDRLNVQFAKRQAVSAEKDNNSKATAANQGAMNTTKSAETTQLLLFTIAHNILFLNLDSDVQQQIISHMYRKEIKKGTDAIKQGDTGDHLYIVESGTFHVTVNGVKVAMREKGTLFGELALMYNSPRAATVTAVSDSVVWVLDRYTFRRTIQSNDSKKFDLYIKFLKKVELLNPLAEYERKRVAEALDEVTFNAGATVFKQGDEGDALYIVYSGEVRIDKKEADGKVREVNRISVGEYFGERALMTNEARAATASAVINTQLLRLDRSAFHSLLGPLEDILQKKVDTYKAPAQAAASTPSKSGAVVPVSSSTVAQTNKRDIPFNQLIVLGTLGKGSFGYVQLVQDKVSKQAYALKAVSKQQIVKTGQQGHVMSEKKAMLLFNHPFCIRLFQTYKDKDRLYFLLEPSLGGELFSVLRERTLFDEDTARFYAASVVLAFEYIHGLNFCYRDLKPENLLLDKSGYLKVTDFGFAKDISSGRTWTLCGTPDYLAPEIVSGKGHGKAVDWWTVGVFIYEMLASYPPFYDEDPMRTYAKIMRGTVSYPSHFSKASVSLINGLLQAKPAKRLGSLKGGVSDIKTHAWFDGFDWSALIERRLTAPIIPKIRSETDLSNFDDYSKTAAPQIQPYENDGTNWDSEF